MESTPIAATCNWKIYRTIDPETAKAFIIRFPKLNLGNRIDSYIDTHLFIDSLGLPTLKLVEKVEFNGKPAIRTEDLNYLKDEIYISPQ